MKRATATVLGFVVAPVLPAIVATLETPAGKPWNLVSVLVGTLFFYSYSLAFTLILGVPTYLAMSKFKPITWWLVLLTGFGLGGLVALIIRLPTMDGLRDVPTMGLLGSATAFLFWLIWRLGADERAQTKSESD